MTKTKATVATGTSPASPVAVSPSGAVAGRMARQTRRSRRRGRQAL